MVGDGRQEAAVGCDEIDGSPEGWNEMDGLPEGSSEELGASDMEGTLDGVLLGDMLGALEKGPHPSST